MKNFLARIVAIVAGVALFVGAFLISVAFFAAAFALGLLVWGYLFWKTRHVRSQLRARGGEREIIEGTVISSSGNDRKDEA